MCGISGIVGYEEPSTADACVRRMSDALARRGPDSSGLHRWDRVMLAHRRLSI
jgi:asparagine synthase (glutamine-hydrolysing)